ncbi:MAG: hypothetical protein OWT28_10110 [Firmicutes bacterium]|nr:hypothetical protein [Bacillota bacterium]
MFLRRDVQCSNDEFKHKASYKHKTTDRGLAESAFLRSQGEGKCYACRFLAYYRDGQLAKALDADTAVCSVDQRVILRVDPAW